MHCLVIQIGGVCEFVGTFIIGLSVALLLTANLLAISQVTIVSAEESSIVYSVQLHRFWSTEQA